MLLVSIASRTMRKLSVDSFKDGQSYKDSPKIAMHKWKGETLPTAYPPYCEPISTCLPVIASTKHKMKRDYKLAKLAEICLFQMRK